MSKESDIDLLEAEYSLFEVDGASSVDGVREYIKVILYDLVEHLKTFREEIKYNYIWKYRAILSNYFSFVIGFEFPDFYDGDTKVLRKDISNCNCFRKILENLLEKLDDNNYLEVYKLCNFIRNKYFDYYLYYEKLRSVNEMEYSGVYMSVPEMMDISSFIRFINDKINKISSNSIVKKKVL